MPRERTLPLPVFVNGDVRARTTLTLDRPEAFDADLSDEALIARLQRSDPAALGILFDRFARLVMSIALRTLQDRGEAEDAVQEIFLYLFRKAASFDPEKGSARGWILQAAFHRTLDRKLYLARRGFYLNSEIDSLPNAQIATADPCYGSKGKLDRNAVKRAFAELPDVQRRTLELFYFEGLSLAEIARKFDCALSNVRHYYYRGLERLRKSTFLKTFSRTKP